MEESGWTIKNLTLFRINDNPNRPREDRQNVDFIYFADALTKIGEPDEEVQKIKWFSLLALPPINQIAFDHHENIKLYLEYLKKPFPLPRMQWYERLLHPSDAPLKYENSSYKN